MASRNRKATGTKSKETITPAEVGTVNAADVVGAETPATETAASEVAAPATGEGNAMNLVLKGTNKSGKTASYGVAGNIGSVRVAKSIITNESFPQTLAELQFKAVDAAKAAKQTAKAERQGKSLETAKAREEKLLARIQKAQEAARKNEEKLARVRKRLAPKDAQAATEEAAGGDSTPAPETGVVTEAQEASE